MNLPLSVVPNDRKPIERLMVPGSRVHVNPSPLYDEYWHFIGKRQDAFYKRLNGEPGPWSDDPIMNRYRFTNVFRAADRVSQDLIRVQRESPDGDQLSAIVRTLVYRMFNRPETWQAIEQEHETQITYHTFNVNKSKRALARMLEQGRPVFTGAYITNPARMGEPLKYENQLELLRFMITDGLPQRLAGAASLEEMFRLIKSYPAMGSFTSYQLTVDLNYLKYFPFDENDFVVPGPGARNGIHMIFDLPPDRRVPYADIIRAMVNRQDKEMTRIGQAVPRLPGGREMRLIDAQNVFCEISKYLRVKAGGARPRQIFHPVTQRPQRLVFPEKWGI